MKINSNATVTKNKQGHKQRGYVDSSVRVQLDVQICPPVQYYFSQGHTEE